MDANARCKRVQVLSTSWTAGGMTRMPRRQATVSAASVCCTQAASDHMRSVSLALLPAALWLTPSHVSELAQALLI